MAGRKDRSVQLLRLCLRTGLEWWPGRLHPEFRAAQQIALNQLGGHRQISTTAEQQARPRKAQDKQACLDTLLFCYSPLSCISAIVVAGNAQHVDINHVLGCAEWERHTQAAAAGCPARGCNGQCASPGARGARLRRRAARRQQAAQGQHDCQEERAASFRVPSKAAGHREPSLPAAGCRCCCPGC